MSFMPWYPDPGSYIRYYDKDLQEIRYRKLTWKRDPLKYPRRLPAIAAGIKGDPLTFKEINPSDDKHHIYLAYLGVKPGFVFYLWHPFDVKNLKWDERISEVDEDTVANITWEESPYEFPTKIIGIQHDRYPAVQPKNIFGATKTPEVIWIVAMYKVIEHTQLSEDELARLKSGSLRSYPIDFGGEL